MSSRTERHSSRELDDDERHYATAPVEEIRRELEHYAVRVEPAVAMVRALIDERTPPRHSARNPETMYLQHLDLIERIAAHIARRSHWTADETAEFVQIARVRLFENDCAILREFEGRSSFSTYVRIVIGRLFQEWRVELWGKWRPSAKARALGEKAVTLERLLSRDGLSFPEAVRALTQARPQSFTVEECEAIYIRLPVRNSRPVLVSDEALPGGLPRADSAEERVCAAEREIALRSAVAGLDRAIGDCSPEDRLLLQLRFWNGRTVPDIARIMNREPKKLHARLERLLAALRRALEDAGIDPEVVGELMDGPNWGLSTEPRPKRTSPPRSGSG